MTSIQTIATAAALLTATAALIDACIGDVRAYRIADRDWMMICAAFLLYTAAQHSLQTAAWHAAAGAAVFAGGAILFALGVWGGGDAKLFAALALLTGFVGLPRFLFVIALAGGIVAAIYAVLRGAKGDNRIPYGLAIAAGGFDWLWIAARPLIAA